MPSNKKDINERKNLHNDNSFDNLSFEKEIWNSGIEMIGGVDECGRGPLAGPVVAGCVVMPKGVVIPELTDSKKITSEKKRKQLSLEVYDKALAYGIGLASVEEIDETDILQATLIAMKRAIEQTNLMLKDKENQFIQFLLIDGITPIPLETNQKTIKKGDFLSHSISCAAIIAKVYRDELMIELDKKYDGIYLWKDNKGYLGKHHQNAIDIYGITPDHRQSWTPSQMAKKNEEAYRIYSEGK